MSSMTSYATNIVCEAMKKNYIDVYEEGYGYENTPQLDQYTLDKYDDGIFTVSSSMPTKECYIGRGWYIKMLKDVYNNKDDESSKEADAIFNGTPSGAQHMVNTKPPTVDVDNVAVIFSRRLSKSMKPCAIPLEYIGWCIIKNN